MKTNYAIAAVLIISAFALGLYSVTASKTEEHQITFSINGESVTMPLNDANIAVSFDDGGAVMRPIINGKPIQGPLLEDGSFYSKERA